MPRLFAVNCRYFPMATEVAICLLLVLVSCGVSTKLQAQTLTTTTISDTVYRADGTAASGTVLISWPSFVSAAGEAVAAGNLAVTIGPATARLPRNSFRTWERLRRVLTTQRFFNWMTVRFVGNTGRCRLPHPRPLLLC